MNVYYILTPLMVLAFIGIMFYVSTMKKRGYSYNKRVLLALVIGIVFGLFIHIFSGTLTTVNDADAVASAIQTNEKVSSYIATKGINIDNFTNVLINVAETKGVDVPQTITGTGIVVELMNVVSGLYIALLQLLVIPLILVSITMAIIDGRKNTKLKGKIFKILGILMATVAVAAIIGIIVAMVTGLFTDYSSLSTLANSSAVVDKSASLSEKATQLSSMSFSEIILSVIPTNFGFLVGGASSAALMTVIFGMFLGYATIQADRRKPEKTKAFIDFLDSLKTIVLSMVLETLKFTPYAVVALMATLVATTSLSSLGVLLTFVIATYVAIILMYGVHLLIVSSLGLSPVKFAKKTWDVLVFGFSSRSSMAALPLTIETQTRKLGVDEASANIAGSFGVTIGQNGCAGIYPAMVVITTWLAMGADITFGKIILLVIVIMISSFGIAGVGGGASFAAVAVLSIMGLPPTAAALLISVEPLLDMARTALNISDSMVAGVVVAKSDKTLDEALYNE